MLVLTMAMTALFRHINHYYSIGVLSVSGFLIALGSALWIESGNRLATPPAWACALALLSVVLGCAAILYILAFLHPFSEWRTEYPGTGARALEYLLRHDPEFLSAVRSFVNAVNSKIFQVASEEYDCHLNDLLGELPGRARRLNATRHRLFMGSLFFGAIALIIIFAGFYLANYTLELSPLGRGTAGFKTSMPEGDVTQWALEAIYYSTVTFATLGYGDIFPQTPWARLISLLEVVTFLIVFTIGLGFALIYIQQSDMAFGELAASLRKKIEHDIRVS